MLAPHSFALLAGQCFAQVDVLEALEPLQRSWTHADYPFAMSIAGTRAMLYFGGGESGEHPLECIA